MTVSLATAFTDVMLNVTNNQAGSLQTLNQINREGGRVRKIVGVITMASQTAATVFGIARIPIPATLLNIEAVTDTSLGSTTIKFGDSASGNSAIYGAAATLTSTNAYTSFLVLDNAPGTAAITAGYDCTTGAATTYTNDSGAGGGYEDIIMTTAAATMPSSGTLVVIVQYMID